MESSYEWEHMLMLSEKYNRRYVVIMCYWLAAGCPSMISIENLLKEGCLR